MQRLHAEQDEVEMARQMLEEAKDENVAPKRPPIVFGQNLKKRPAQRSLMQDRDLLANIAPVPSQEGLGMEAERERAWDEQRDERRERRTQPPANAEDQYQQAMVRAEQSVQQGELAARQQPRQLQREVASASSSPAVSENDGQNLLAILAQRRARTTGPQRTEPSREEASLPEGSLVWNQFWEAAARLKGARMGTIQLASNAAEYSRNVWHTDLLFLPPAAHRPNFLEQTEQEAQVLTALGLIDSPEYFEAEEDRSHTTLPGRQLLSEWCMDKPGQQEVVARHLSFAFWMDLAELTARYNEFADDWQNGLDADRNFQRFAVGPSRKFPQPYRPKSDRKGMQKLLAFHAVVYGVVLNSRFPKDKSNYNAARIIVYLRSLHTVVKAIKVMILQVRGQKVVPYIHVEDLVDEVPAPIVLLEQSLVEVNFRGIAIPQSRMDTLNRELGGLLEHRMPRVREQMHWDSVAATIKEGATAMAHLRVTMPLCHQIYRAFMDLADACSIYMATPRFMVKDNVEIRDGTTYINGHPLMRLYGNPLDMKESYQNNAKQYDLMMRTYAAGLILIADAETVIHRIQYVSGLPKPTRVISFGQEAEELLQRYPMREQTAKLVWDILKSDFMEEMGTTYLEDIMPQLDEEENRPRYQRNEPPVYFGVERFAEMHMPLVTQRGGRAQGSRGMGPGRGILKGGRIGAGPRRSHHQ